MGMDLTMTDAKQRPMSFLSHGCKTDEFEKIELVLVASSLG